MRARRVVGGVVGVVTTDPVASGGGGRGGESGDGDLSEIGKKVGRWIRKKKIRRLMPR